MSDQVAPARSAEHCHHEFPSELAEKQILIAHWGIRDGSVQPTARVRPGQTLTLTVESFEEHRELRGER
ncbi:MAG: hypothetical protein ACKPHU_02330, partial [Planctomycetaceae bacterium]